MTANPAADLVIRGARTPTHTDPVDLRIGDGRIEAITPSDSSVAPGGTSGQVVDAEGCLVVPAFASPHLHLCKVYSLDRVGDGALDAYSAQGMGSALAAIDLASAAKADYQFERIATLATQVLLDGLGNGVLHVRAFADVDTKAGLTGVQGVLEAKRRVAGRVDVEVVAFPQDGVVREPGAKELVSEALAAGADVVGGIPWIERTDTEAQAHIDAMFDLAAEHDADVAMLVDDAGDPMLRTTEMLARTAIARGWEGRVTACHARALATYAPPSVARLAELARDAGLAFVSNPHTGPLHLPIFALRDAGVTVALGQDDVVDAYYPFGTHDLLEVAFLGAHVLHRYAQADAEAFLEMVTVDAQRAMGREPGAVTVGSRADLVVLPGTTAREALRLHASPRTVVAGGRVVAAGTRDPGLVDGR